MRIEAKTLQTLRHGKFLKLELAALLKVSHRTIERYLQKNSFPDKFDSLTIPFVMKISNQEKAVQTIARLNKIKRHINACLANPERYGETLKSLYDLQEKTLEQLKSYQGTDPK